MFMVERMGKNIKNKFLSSLVLLLAGLLASPVMAIETLSMEKALVSGDSSSDADETTWEIVDKNGPATITYNLADDPGKIPGG